VTEAARPARKTKITAKPQDTRAALVEVAARVFAEEGYLQTSIRDVARRGSVTTGAIYGHFRNKADLLAEAINKRVSEELEASSMNLGEDPDYVAVITRNARNYPERRQLRALIVQGAAAAQVDEETRSSLRAEQMSHLSVWIEGYERDRDALGIDPGVDIPTAVLYTWAAEGGLGVLESLGIEPKSRKAWADVMNRAARALQLPPDDPDRATPSKRGGRRKS
jgi:AcrR family transcriptional regulator